LDIFLRHTGGIGFIGAGTDVSELESHLQKATTLLNSTSLPTSSTLPIGIGFINWGASLGATDPLIQQYRPSAVWFFAPRSLAALQTWTTETRNASPGTKIWVQIGSVEEAINTLTIGPDVLVVQGTDAGGHGRTRGAGIVPLFPEVHDAVHTRGSEHGGKVPILLAAGGIVESRTAASALVLGASGVVLGTRLLASHEANISAGYQNTILNTFDGGQTTVRTKVYDELRGTTGWAETHNARGVINKSYTDWEQGMELEENKALYEKEMKKGDEGWGVGARMTTYAGSGVGLIKTVMPAGEIVKSVREGVGKVLSRFNL
jgi:nitronate monooxygenase